MILFIIDFLQVLLPFLYFATVWAYAKAFFSGSAPARKAKTPLLAVTLSAHLAYLLARTAAFEHPPITSLFEILSVIAFSISLAYLILEWKTKVKGTGYFILNLPFFFQLVSSLLVKDQVYVDPVLRNNLLGIHVSSALLGYAAITISAVYGFLYLMLYHRIKSNRFGVIYERLPNLEVLERLSFVSTAIAFVFLTVAIAVGLVWLPKAFSDFSYTDPKLVGTVLIWLVYGTGLAARKLAGWYGKRIVILSIVGFGVAIISMTLINIFFSGFHNFY
ncbi:MAG TPA: cytochrome c biogenesis protein CcsA [Bacteroidota bacterium]